MNPEQLKELDTLLWKCKIDDSEFEKVLKCFIEECMEKTADFSYHEGYDEGFTVGEREGYDEGFEDGKDD